MNIQTDPTMRTWAEIDLDALLHNFNVAKQTGKQVMCIIKADGYGHGAAKLSCFLEKHGAAAFAVACLDEAIILREAGVLAPVLVLGYTQPEYARLFAKYNLSAAIIDREAALELSGAASAANITIPIHIKVDTGMSRLGFPAQTAGQIDEAVADIIRCAALPGLSAEGIFTHFAAADTPSEEAYTMGQLERFQAVLSDLRAQGLGPLVTHASNSAALLNYPQAHFDMVREGILLYGLYPDSTPRENGMLKPVMTLKTRVVQVKEYPAGTTISYGRTFETQRDTRVAVLAAGYADGYPRRQSNLGEVTINGKRYPQIGRVCMDMCMVDVTGSDVKRGDIAVLFGQGGPSLEEVSRNVGTINYELVCLVTPRIKRVYVGVGESQPFVDPTTLK